MGWVPSIAHQEKVPVERASRPFYLSTDKIHAQLCLD